MVPTSANTYPFHSSDLIAAMLKIKKRNLDVEISLSKVIVFFVLQAFFNRFCCLLKTWLFEQGKHILFVSFNSRLIEWINSQSVST